MSTDLSVFIPTLKDGLLHQISTRLTEFGVQCEFDPGFEIEDEAHNGFVSIRLKMLSVGDVAHRKESYLTGFECALSNFNYADELRKVQNPPKPNFLQKLLFKEGQSPPRQHLADPDVDKVLANCKKAFDISYDSINAEMISNAFAAVLAELTTGVVYDPQDDKYLLPQAALALIPALIEDLPTDGWEQFEGWES
jgi:hypothetical protein